MKDTIFKLAKLKKLDEITCEIEKNSKNLEFSIRGKDEFQMQDVNAVFDYIPDKTNDSAIYMKAPVPIPIGVKPVNMETFKNDTSSQG